MYYVILTYDNRATDHGTDIIELKSWDELHKEFLLTIANDIHDSYKIEAVIKGSMEFEDSVIYKSIREFYIYHCGQEMNKVLEFAFKQLDDLDQK